MKRLCFVSPNLTICQNIVLELEKVGITDSHVHVMGKHTDWVDKAHLHNATILQTTNIIPALRAGILLALFLVAGIFALFYFTLPPEVQLGPLAIAGIIGFGLMFGTWAALLVGFGTKDPVVKNAEAEIASGHYLLMVDVPADRAKEIRERILNAHQEVHIAEAAHMN